MNRSQLALVLAVQRAHADDDPVSSTPGFSLTAPVLTLLTGTTDNTPLWGFELTSPLAGDVIRLEWDDAIPYASQVSFNDYTLVSGDLSGDFQFTFGLSPFANSPWSWRAYHRRGGSSSAASNEVSETIAADVTAPTLSSPTDTATAATTADVGVSTNEANGTLYCVVTTSATPPTAARVKLGQDNSGVAATYASSQVVSSTGAKTFSVTGLTASTAYTAHFMHEDANGNQSTVSSGNGFTTTSSSTALDPAKKNAGLTLSGDGLIATGTGSNQSALSIASASGKKYFEARRTVGNGAFGVAPAAFSFATEWVGSTDSIGWHPDGNVYMNGGSVGVSVSPHAVNDWCAMAIDPTAELFWLKNITAGGTWNNTGADPDAGTGGISFSALTGPYFAAICCFASTASIETNFGGSAYQGTPPATFGNI